MINNYLKIAWRILLRQKLFSMINIFGLVIGMVACLLIVQYISFELSYDKFHADAANIYRIRHQSHSEGSLTENLPKTYSAVGPALQADFAEVQQQTRVSKLVGQVSAQQPDGSIKAFNEQHLYAVEASFLKMFSFPMVDGTAAALNNPNAIVITQTTANKYFPNQSAIGKTLKIQQQVSGTDITATVTGVCDDVPANSHLQFDFLVAQDRKAGDWVYPDSYTYIKLSPNTDQKTFEAKLPAFVKKHGDDKASKSSFTQGKTNVEDIAFTLQPLTRIHLYSNLTDEISTAGNGNMVWYLGLIAALILVIAYINYVNLSTAKVIERAKEVGIRKVLGSQRKQLIIQFLFESLLLNIISIVMAVVVVVLAMPWFSALCGVKMQFTLWKDYTYVLGFVACLASGVLLSAFYPALILSNYKPVQILKGKFQNTAQSFSLRKSLVVFQFAATITFMIGTMVVYRQVNFMKDANKGMDMKQTLIVVAPQNVRATDADAINFMHQDSVFQTELMRSPRVFGVTSSSSIPGETINYIMSYTRPLQDKGIRLPTLEIGSQFLKQFKVQLIAGENISATVNYIKQPMMLNEAAVVSLGFKNANDAIGKIIQTKNGRGKVFENEVVGVVKNFHQTSLKDAFTPTVFRLIDPSSVTHYELKVNTADLQATLAAINNTYKSVFAGSAFDYFFLDEFFDNQYQTEQHFGKVFSLFSGFAVFVACLGLFGLTLITINQRIKEIGIRKILGASVQNILVLIAKDFVALIVIANIIALPLAYWGSHQWLQNYQFRIGFSIWFFVLPMLSVCLIAVTTISFQAIKAAIANPVKSLRTE
ncbi:ABC transporter permease [Mucilaginibacter glaciei]|uniref:ABC transporter permease n=1 Tax=Mucilaginibacter glaciei TaxID=2772109 RepID=A0A926NRW6_9SPHI|nr:ABC transporter permease [Mucilaginibacter glaciei]MBD1394233.1 ABC transporter permease [Mucilaginibacter glaciei]